MKKHTYMGIISVLLSALFFLCCSSDPLLNEDGSENSLNVPAGFKVEVFAENLPDVRAMSIGQQGTIFAGSRGAGKLYALIDQNEDYQIDEVITIDEGLNMPVGVAYYEGDLYASAVNKILKYADIEDNLNNIPEPVVVSDAFPSETHHGWKFIDFGPDGKLYVPVGAPCNICHEDEDTYANIMRMEADGSDLEVYSRGVRNTVGFAWHPITRELWFTDNGRDWLGDDLPPCELNNAPEKGMHFGYPFCHGTDVSDPEFGEEANCKDFTPPAWNFDAHTAPLGMCFYTGNSFPEQYQNSALIALHGSWNRSTKIGYEVLLASFSDDNQVEKVTPFVTGFLRNGKVYGRPVDVLQLPDGSILISDDRAGRIYRVSYVG